MTVVLPIRTVIGNKKWTKIWSGDWIPSPHTTHSLAIHYALYLREGQNNHIQRKVWVRVSKKVADKSKNQFKWRKSTIDEVEADNKQENNKLSWYTIRYTNNGSNSYIIYYVIWNVCAMIFFSNFTCKFQNRCEEYDGRPLVIIDVFLFLLLQTAIGGFFKGFTDA